MTAHRMIIRRTGSGRAFVIIRWRRRSRAYWTKIARLRVDTFLRRISENTHLRIGYGYSTDSNQCCTCNWFSVSILTDLTDSTWESKKPAIRPPIAPEAYYAACLTEKKDREKRRNEARGDPGASSCEIYTRVLFRDCWLARNKNDRSGKTRSANDRYARA